MKPIREMSQAEVGAFVQAHLRQRGIEVVLSGGASVAIYSANAYVSNDVDLVNVHSASDREIKAAMGEAGFREKGRYFTHPQSTVLVEFPPGPLAVGTEPVASIAEIAVATGVLRIISPTDCVKDRLASYYHWGDQEALRQAILVAQAQTIDLDEVARWSKAEGKLAEFRRIRSSLLSAGQG
ncbi:MAG TPA: hypothetical protein VJJ70_08185 [Anaerolineales bacterium]|nr:hypothetical protein [Anaerolineales bacterium]